MGCGAAEATGLGFVCLVVINPHVLRVDFGPFLYINFPILPPPPQERREALRTMRRLGPSVFGYQASTLVLPSSGGGGSFLWTKGRLWRKIQVSFLI